MSTTNGTEWQRLLERVAEYNRRQEQLRAEDPRPCARGGSDEEGPRLNGGWTAQDRGAL